MELFALRLRVQRRRERSMRKKDLENIDTILSRLRETSDNRRSFRNYLLESGMSREPHSSKREVTVVLKVYTTPEWSERAYFAALRKYERDLLVANKLAAELMGVLGDKYFAEATTLM